jgi:hypothetical protein
MQGGTLAGCESAKPTSWSRPGCCLHPNLEPVDPLCSAVAHTGGAAFNAVATTGTKDIGSVVVVSSQRLKLPRLSTKRKWLVMHMHVQISG